MAPPVDNFLIIYIHPSSLYSNIFCFIPLFYFPHNTHNYLIIIICVVVNSLAFPTKVLSFMSAGTLYSLFIHSAKCLLSTCYVPDPLSCRDDNNKQNGQKLLPS